MEPTPARKKRDYSGRVYPDRKCLDCPVVFSPRSSQQKRCGDCQYRRNLGKACESERRKRAADPSPARYCVDCGVELPVQRGRPLLRCVPCRERYGKEVAREKHQEYVADGRNKEYQRRYRLANPEQARESARRYRQAHPENDLASIHRRRMRLDAGNLDALDRMLSRFYRCAIEGDSCFYCGSPDTQCVDHYFPLAKGGTDRFFNLVRACRADNLSKGTMCGTKYLLLLSGG
jgi:hypothetical protein